MNIIEISITCNSIVARIKGGFMENNKMKRNQNTVKLPKKYYVSVFIEQLVILLCLNISIAYITENAVFSVEKNDIHYLYNAIFLACAITIIAMVTLPFAQYISGKTVKETIADLKLRCYEHLLLISKDGYSSHEGVTMSHFSDDIKEIEDLYVTKYRNLVGVILTGPVSFIALLGLNIYIAIVVLVFGIITLIYTGVCAGINRKYSEQLQNAKGSISSILLDILNGLEEIKAFDLLVVMKEKYRESCNKQLKATKKLGRVDALLFGLSGFMYFFKQIAVIAVGIFLFSKNMLSLGELVGSVYLLVTAGYFFDNLGSFYASVQKSLVCKERIQDFLLTNEEELDDNITAICNVENDAPLYEFKDICFGYGNQNEILKNVNLQICKNEYIAVVGPSGSGKSTIIKLLMRFYKESSGQLLVNGKPISSYSLQQLRNQCAFVPQEPYLFPGTIDENISYGNIKASDEEIVACCKKALCHDFIMELADGYDTVLNNETNLSGGQKQRIAIARALLKNAPVLILDEPTSALDAESENEIIKTLSNLKHELTIIVVTHKLYTTNDCDKIVRIENGNIDTKGER